MIANMVTDTYNIIYDVKMIIVTINDDKMHNYVHIIP